MNYYPIFINLKNKKVLVIGGGKVAFRKIKSLLHSNAKIDIIAKNINNEELSNLINTNKIKLINDHFSENIIDNYYFIIASTDDNKLNKHIFQCCEKRKKLCNVVDNKKFCSFIIPSIVDRNPLKIAISSSGYSPVISRIYKEKLESIIPYSISKATEIAGKYREKIKKLIPNMLHRKNFWETLLASNFIFYIEKQEFEMAEKIILDFINGFVPKKGNIYIIGAGPGKAGMLTIDATYAIQKADVVLHDELISKEILNIPRKDSQIINIGKRYKKHNYTQDEINKLLVKYFKQDKSVVRLKGGDPFIFGRGGEELLFLIENKIPFHIIPGITSGIGVPSHLGIPLTYRNISKTLILISGHVIDESSIQWNLLIEDSNTIVIYMGLHNADLIQKKLIEKGKNPNTPFAIISSGTIKEQNTIIGKLHQLSIKSKQAKTPAIIVIGKVIDVNTQLLIQN